MGDTAGTGLPETGSSLPETVLLVGLGVTNTAAARALAARGHTVAITDDGDGAEAAAVAAELRCEYQHRPDRVALGSLLRSSDAFMATPGLPESHPVFSLADSLGIPGISEFDLAAAWDDRDLLAVTGTNGKTTVVSLVASMLEHSGIRCAAVGNLEVPLVAAIDDPVPRCFVVEASSFRLAHSARFAPHVGTWLNFAADHLDVHRDLDSYRRAKARIWSGQGPGDISVFNAEDPVVSSEMVHTAGAGRRISFALDPDAGGHEVDFHESHGRLCGPGGPLVETAALWSRLPHDRRNVLAAAATASFGGATPDGIRVGASEFRGLPHRVELVGEVDGILFYNDSKATTPHATLAALVGFEHVVLIAGGRNKGIDLSVMGAATNLRGVVGIGEAGPEVLDALGQVRGALAESMPDAVDVASSMAHRGDVVMLSPGCASFDWYGSYSERGDHFRTVVRDAMGRGELGDDSNA
jgi:UDP-N-acetylmuramoylalanine--D-glutamate ligase